MNDAMGDQKEVKETNDAQPAQEITPVAKSSMQGPSDANPVDNHHGEFEIIDWSDYPDGPKPEGPFKLLDEDEYASARERADAANLELHRNDPSLRGLDIHEVKPVRFGGDPQDIDNKIALTRKDHAEYTTWWNRKQREVQS